MNTEKKILKKRQRFLRRQRIRFNLAVLYLRVRYGVSEEQARCIEANRDWRNGAACSIRSCVCLCSNACACAKLFQKRK